MMNSEILDILLVFTLGAAIVAVITIGDTLKKRRRLRLFNQELPPDKVAIIERNIALCRIMPEELKLELRGRVNIFLREKEFEGCGGLEITDEIKVTIAASACVLLLNKNLDYYPGLNSVLVYPSAYVAHGSASRIGSQIVYDSESARLGESWQHGSLVLAWDHVLSDACSYGSGHNVALHEFAHQLDQANGVADGIPILNNKDAYPHWMQVMRQEFEHLRHEVKFRHRDVIDDYGATNPAEFFAVATETFFCCSDVMKKVHPELYQELAGFYQLDPAEWVKNLSAKQAHFNLTS
ncbi:MAG: M90 family metallopeptidase [Victivallaceae bacterium]